jgi:hypothetical protein
MICCVWIYEANLLCSPGPDAFQEDPASRSLSQRPIVKSAANVIVLIDSLYSMLRTTPFHRESVSLVQPSRTKQLLTRRRAVLALDHPDDRAVLPALSGALPG